MTQPLDLHSFDIFAFCRAQGSVQAQVVVREMPRIIAETSANAPAGAPDETFSYALTGFERKVASESGGAARQKSFVDLAVTGRVWLDCQRCLGGYAEQVTTSMRFEVVASEEEAEAASMDDDDVDVIVGSSRFDLLSLIEDEILLGLPVAPKHEVCPAVHDSLVTGTDGEAEPEAPQEEKRPSPFAALASLKTKH